MLTEQERWSREATPFSSGNVLPGKREGTAHWAHCRRNFLWPFEQDRGSMPRWVRRRTMAKTCPSCGYSAIGPFIDNCPICAEPVRGVASDRAGASGAAGGFGPSSWPPLLVGGWIVLGLILTYLFWGNGPWLLLNLALCGAAWWAVAQGHTLLLRLLGGGLLVLFVPGIWLAAQPSILPGLDQRELSPQ